MSTLFACVKLLHILSATTLFGTGLGTAFQMWAAHRGRDVRAIATVATHVVWADFLFTTPAIVIQPLTGIAMERMEGFDPYSSWLVATYALFVLTGMCWLPVVWIQFQVRDIAVAAAKTNSALPARYFTLMSAWFWLGWPAFFAVLAIFALMVAKPDLW